ncbi:MAG: hypothetical protein RL226_139 [Bacteroidota bacterium]
MQRLLFLFLIFFSIQSFAQLAIVEGTVSDNEGKTIPGVNVSVKGNISFGTSTDIYGKYRLELRPGTYTLVFSFVGYDKAEMEVTLQPSQRITKNISLKPGIAIGQVVIETQGDRSAPIQRIDPKVASRIPSPRNTIEDLLMQAPVSFTSELSSSYSVRGGSFDENLVYVNDIQFIDLFWCVPVNKKDFHSPIPIW